MRRGSLVGPLLLILIGLWFLMSTLRPDLPLLDLAARFWPFLLIGWGTLRLLEIFLWTARGRAIPRSGVSGGEWTLVVFICLIGSGLYAVSYYRPWNHFGMISANRVEIFGRSYDYTIPEQKVEAGKVNRVLVENLRGTVHVTGADVREVSASGRKSVRAMQEKDADEGNRQTPLEVTAQTDMIVVRTNQDRVTGDQRVSDDLDVTVPRNFSVEVRGRNNDSIEISAIAGGAEVSADDASVRLQNIGGNAHVDLRKSDSIRAADVKGTVEIQNDRGRDVELDTIGGESTINGSYSGDLRLKNLAKALHIQSPSADLRVEQVPGEIHMDLGRFDGTNLVGPIRIASSRSRDVQLEQFTDSLELTMDHGDITLRPAHVPLPKIDARTRNGQVEISLPGKAEFDLKAITNHGEVNNEYGDSLRTVSDDQERGRRRHGGSITGTMGQGPTIIVQTDRGSVTVRRDSGAPLAAQNQKPNLAHVTPEVEEH
jgi:DUF4097 and DUF4098 domain-containing protein YvlB